MMDVKKVVVEQMAREVLTGWVNPLVRDQEAIIKAARAWAGEMYDYIESMQKIEACCPAESYSNASQGE